MKNFIASLCLTLFASATMVSTANAQSAGLADCLSMDVMDFPGTIVDAAVATPELSTLVDAVLAAGLDEALATTENITVYAPTNDAFAALGDDILGVVTGNVDLLSAILTYHVTPFRADPRRFVEASSATTLQGQQVYFDRYNQTPFVNNAEVNCQGVRASNGVVWIINSVLLPSL